MSSAAGLSRTLREVGPAIIYNSGSNILGFSPLVLSGLIPLQQFGWLISFSLFFSGVATLTIMPAVVQLSATRRMWRALGPLDRDVSAGHLPPARAEGNS